MEIKIGDFVKVDYDMYANGLLVQTTNEKKAEKANLEKGKNKFEPVTLVLGKNFILKSFDDAILKKEKGEIDLDVENAFGKKDKKLLKTFPVKTFEEHKLKPVVGVTYDFNGMYGAVKAVTGGRVLVDFNNPLAGKKIKINYEVKGKIVDINKKVEFVFETILKLPKELFNIKTNDSNLTIEGPKELIPIKEQIKTTLNEFIKEFKNYKFNIIEKKGNVTKDKKAENKN